MEFRVAHVALWVGVVGVIIGVSESMNFFDARLDRCLSVNPTGLRLFHPAFPLEVLNPVSRKEAEDLYKIKAAIAPGQEAAFAKEYHRLPWFVMPRIGVPEVQTFMSKNDIQDTFQKSKHLGQLFW